jgi:hypothetical protein
MAAGAVQVTGLKEVRRGLRKIDASIDKELRRMLKAAGEPVRAEWQRLMSSVNARSAAGYRVAVRARGVSVEQRIRRTTGNHPEYGSLQMRRGLRALSVRREQVIEHVETDVRGVIKRAGF